jgi:hypothetical protein
MPVFFQKILYNLSMQAMEVMEMIMAIKRKEKAKKKDRAKET